MTAPIDQALLAKIRAARALPSPPAVTAKLIELGENPNIGLDAIIDVLQTDAALCARLLRLANSPLYARRRRTPAAPPGDVPGRRPRTLPPHSPSRKDAARPRGRPRR